MIFGRISKNVLGCIVIHIVFAGMVFSQIASKPTFEVATVKPSLHVAKLAAQLQQTGQMPAIGPHVDRARAQYTFMTLKDLIATAYNLKPFEVSGPDWISDVSQRFDIVGKMPEGSTVDQAPQMLQALLAERFKLTVHRENKEHPVMALVVGKAGPKVRESAPDPALDFDENTPLKPGERQMDTPQGPVRMTVDARTGDSVTNMGKRGVWTQKMGAGGTLHLEGTGTTMSSFADLLTQITQMTGSTGTQVVDMTGLTGHYSVSLDFSLADLLKIAQAAGLNVPQRGGEPSAGVASDPSGSSSVADGIQALGLKLESRRAPTEQLIVDHVEKLSQD